MPLEATILCLDNSEFMRNGDYSPTRFEAQRDAVNIIANAKTNSNPESTVACMKMAGGCQTLATLSTDVGRILSAMHNIPLKGGIEFCKALQVAALCLKHRMNKNQRQRIIAFVGSPIVDEKKALVKLAKKLKKNSVSVDVINFGEDSAANTELLEAFNQAVDSGDSSHLLTVPPGPHLLGDMVMSSPIVLGDNAVASDAGGMGGDAGGNDFAEFGGIDPNLEPELAMALRMSLEEERARAAAAAKASEDNTEGNSDDKPVAQDMETDDADLAAALSAAGGAATSATAVEEEADGDDDLAAALALSMGGVAATTPDNTASTSQAMEEDDQDELAKAMALSMQGAADQGDDDGGDADIYDEDAALAAALAMSTQTPSATKEEEEEADDDEDAALAAALAMSTQTPSATKEEKKDDDDEEAALAAALAMSKETPSATDDNMAVDDNDKKKAKEEEEDPAQDAAFLQSVVAQLPGVDPNDPAIQTILEQFKNKEKK